MPRSRNLLSHGVVLAWLALAGCGDGDQRRACTEVAKANLGPAHPDPNAWIEECVKQRWTQRQRECHARTAGLQALFCDE